MTEALFGAAALAAPVVASACVRAAFIAASQHGAVDHYYWILAARAYRTQRRLPVRIAGKYLLEDERQAYPPGFGAFLALFPDRLLRSPSSVWLMLGIDALTLMLLAGAGVAIGLTTPGLAALIAMFGLAPVLAAYNTQITSRGLGNLALVLSLLAQAAAVNAAGPLAVALWLAAVAGAAAVLLTHKMTTQFLLALWLPWSLALESWLATLVPVAALAAATAVTGTSFQRLQWRAHLEIVLFWNRNWRHLGAHPFRQSPLYGDPASQTPTAFHQPGLRGAFRLIALAFGYLPAAWVLPLTLPFAPPPPAWLFAWLAVALVLAVATLLVPTLKCIGTGHYYLFNAVPPAGLWWGLLLASPAEPVILLSAVAVALTVASLAAGWRRRRRMSAEDSLAPVVAQLAVLPGGKVAAFPYTAAERIAFETPHAVFWGGHGLGFTTLEPYYPVFRRPLGEAMRQHGIDYVVLDTVWWPEGEATIAGEFGGVEARRFGRWQVYALPQPCGTTRPTCDRALP